MTKLSTKRKIEFRRRYLTLDKYMSGNFWPLFKNTLLFSLIAFLFLAFIAWILSGWSLMETFIQLTNPQVHRDDALNPSVFGDLTVSSYGELFIVPIVNLFGLFVLNGVILTILVNWVTNRKERFEKGKARYDYIFSKRFAVIIGGHPAVANLARDLITNGKNDYILIQTKREPEIVRGEIAAVINKSEITDRIIIYAGNRTSEYELNELHLQEATEIYIIGEPFSIDGRDHDAINMQTWEIINRYPRKNSTILPCHVMFEYQSTFKAFQFTDLNTRDGRIFQFIPFNIYENWAQQVLISPLNSSQRIYTPIDGIFGLSYKSRQRVHLIIIGMSKMGLSLAIEAAHIAHYPNFNNPEAGHPRTLITFIDNNARQEMAFFMHRFNDLFQLARWRYVKAPENLIPTENDSWDIYTSVSSMDDIDAIKPYRWNDPTNNPEINSPYYGNYLGNHLIDIDFEFIDGNVALPSVQKYLKDACMDQSEDEDIPASKTTIAVCLPSSPDALSTVLYFDDIVYKTVQQIWVYQSKSGALIENISNGFTGDCTSKFRKIRPFGMLDQCDYLVRINNSLPKIVAYAYKCLDFGTSLYHEYERLSIQELSERIMSNWTSISSEGGKSAIAKQWSNLYCANSFGTKMRAVHSDLAQTGVIEDNILLDQLAKIEHNRWVFEQLLIGIRPPSKDFAESLPIQDGEIRAILKSQNTHPDLISNEKLASSQAYDVNIVKIMPLAIHIAKQMQTI